jgi:hypothetical protein
MTGLKKNSHHSPLKEIFERECFPFSSFLQISFCKPDFFRVPEIGLNDINNMTRHPRKINKDGKKKDFN